ncbi:MAG: iron-containing alcohol dehydrogenase, partial [Rhizobiaceae bacterium]
MKSTFNHTNLRSTIVFGKGRSSELADWMNHLNCERALFLATPHQAGDVMLLGESVGDRCAGLFGEAAMHTPVEVTDRALVRYEQSGADCIVAYGGGSTTGLAKALSHRTGATQIVIATTYAGSEVTPILGQTENNIKTTIRSDEILPDLVIYDPLLTLGLPVPMSVTSGLNAMAHAAEALYAHDS